jgi:hypothetical protein
MADSRDAVRSCAQFAFGSFAAMGNFNCLMTGFGRFRLFASLKFMPNEWQLCADKAVHCWHTQIRLLLINPFNKINESKH